MLTFIPSPLTLHPVSPLPKRFNSSPPHPFLTRASLDPSHIDWRAFRARLVRSETSKPSDTPIYPSKPSKVWAHPVPFIEQGTLLVASPEHFTASHSCAFFANTLVFILDHTPTSTAGLILNRPIARSLPLLSTPPDLSLGGPVGLDTVVVLHRDHALGRPVVGAIRAAAFKDVAHRVEQGVLDSEHCRFFCGYSGWAPGQLQEEVDHGVWFTCAASDDLVMSNFQPDSLAKVLRLMGGRFGDIATLLDDRNPTNS